MGEQIQALMNQVIERARKRDLLWEMHGGNAEEIDKYLKRMSNRPYLLDEFYPELGFEVGDIEMIYQPKTGRWNMDVGTLDIMKDNPHAQEWFAKTHPDLDWGSLKEDTRKLMAMSYTEEFLNLVPEGSTVNLKGALISAIKDEKSGAKIAGTKKSTGKTVAQRKQDIYNKRFSKKKGFSVSKSGQLTFRKGVVTTPKPGSKFLDTVPEEIVTSEFNRYAENLKNKKGIRVEDNSFEFDKKRYGFEKANRSSSLTIDNEGYKLYRAGDKQAIEGNRRAMLAGLTPQMTEAEWLEIRDIYRKAADLGVEVDHIQPLELGGLHHPRNLQLLTREDNRAKGASFSSDIETKQLKYKDKAKQWDRPLSHSKKDYSWARKQTLDNNVFKHIDGFSTYGRKTDIYANIIANAASQNYIGAAMGTVPLALTAKPVQKGIFSLAKRFGAKRAAALAPGAGAVISGIETSGYLSQGRTIQAGVAALRGVTGEIPILEPVSVFLDLGNTVTDYLTGN